MRKKLLYSFSLLFLLFSIGAGLTMLYTYSVSGSLESVITLHKIEIIRQNLVINTQTVQSNLYATGTIFGKELDTIIDNVTALDNSINGCISCHHDKAMSRKLNEMYHMVQQYKEAISFLVTSSANEERITRLKTVAVSIGDSLLAKSQEMATLADRSLQAKTETAIKVINNSRIILTITLLLTFCMGLLIALSMTKQITKPVDELVKAARMIAAGNLGYTTTYTDKTEFGELAENFNAMSAALKEEQDKIENYIRQLSKLYDITILFYILTEDRNIYSKICQNIANLFNAKDCLILFSDKTRDVFIPQFSTDPIDEKITKDMAIERKLAEDMVKLSNGFPVVFNEQEKDERFLPLISGSSFYTSILIGWLQNKGTLHGIIRLSGKEGGFSEDDVKVLSILANHMSVAIENAELYINLQEKMSELRETQEQLIQSAKLAAIGELASNIAHEINNPLTSIIGFTELSREEEELGAIKNNLNIIEKESLRARDIVRQLLDFARKKPIQPIEVNIADILREVIPLVSALARSHRVKIIEEYETIPSTIADPNQLKQVFINIINNAIHAMSNGGSLTISTSIASGYVVIKFRDTGPGIPKEIINKIFEPFFSTKKEKGTGLGLSISYRIVQAHGGRIEVESTEGLGTTFAVKLPLKINLQESEISSNK